MSSTTTERYEESQGFCSSILIYLSYLVVIVTFPISVFFCIKIVQQYERAVIFRLGRMRSGDAAGPGLFFIIPWLDECRKSDMRTMCCDVPPQKLLTKDSVTITVDAVVFFRVFQPKKAVMMGNLAASTQLLAQTTLRNVLGTKTLSEVLSAHTEINAQIKRILDKPTGRWGVVVDRVEVKNVSLPRDMQRSMAAEAEAAREARAQVTVADGEKKASRALREAAKIIGESPMALQLRYLQTLNTISDKHNSTIIIPFPADLLHVLASKRASSS
uniref:Band 7 domain-containing protein n=1 Tax=Globodera rostochiensis TaxID=31243 RepID=A0A914HUY2_GLORO